MNTMGMWRPHGDNMETTWGQHEDNGDNSILFEDLLFAETPPPMGGCMGCWVDQWVNGWINGWVNGWHQVKSLKIK